MKIPSVPTVKIIDSDGNLNSVWVSFFQNLVTQMILNLSDSGYVVPFVPNDFVLQLNNTDNIGKILYNTTTSRMMINNAGTFENIQT